MSTMVQQALSLARQPNVKRIARWGVLTLVVVLVMRAFWQNWQAVAAFHWHLNPWLLLLAGLCFMAQELTYGLIWRMIVEQLGLSIPWLPSIRIYLLAEFVRYIPGNVWHVLARVQMAEQYNIPRAQGFASMTIELATKIAAGLVLFCGTVPFWGDLGRLGGTVGHAGTIILLVGVPLLLAGLQPRVLEWGLNLLARLMKRGPITIAITYRGLLIVTAAWLANWAVAGIGCWLAVLALGVGQALPTALPLLIGINALGWIIGFLSFITPSGLGFREGTVALLLVLAGVVPNLALAGLVAIIIARLFPTVAEVLAVGLAYTQKDRPA